MTLLTETSHSHASSADHEPAALSIRDLHVAYGGTRDRTGVVHGVDLELRRGQTLALVGQSGSGKSTIAQAAGGLLPVNGRVTAGSIRIAGLDVTTCSRRQWQALRGTGVGYVPQDPLSSLDPLQSIGRQVGHALLLHTDATRGTVRQRTVELLGHVGIREPGRRVDAHPHELSGGQLQRVLIAMAIAGKPRLLIADEPTSALDVTVQRTILDLLGELQRELDSAILFITHDLAIAGDRSDRIAVLNHGRLVDSGSTATVLAAPGDGYTRRLFGDAPSSTPHKYRHLLDDGAAAGSARREAVGDVTADALIVRDLVKHYGDPGKADGRRPAVEGISLTVRRGSTHALVGESGSGKTTIARVIAGLEPFTSGSVRVNGRPLKRVPRAVNTHARQLQLIHQNPLSALDPKFNIRRSIEEPLLLHAGGPGRAARGPESGASGRPATRDASAAGRDRRVREVLDRVALPENVLERKPRELSGGQRQRVAIARALVLAPEILILDEPTSALDVTVQARIIELLFELREAHDLTYLFISHDLSLVRQIADEVSVLEHGRLVESGPTAQVFEDAAHDYTRRLIDSIPGSRHTAGKAIK